MNYVIAVGDLAEGFHFHGPFETEAQATEWADVWFRGSGQTWTVHRLNAAETL